MLLEQEMDAAQTLGLIKGLTSVVQEQSNAMKATSDQIQHLAITVENLIKVQQAPVPSSQDYVCPIWSYPSTQEKKLSTVSSNKLKVCWFLQLYQLNIG